MGISWQIVKFIEENDMVEAIPSSWIYKEAGRFKCLWPETISASKVAAAIQAQEEPKENWKSIPVEIMSMPYDNFQVANKKAKMAEYTSELDAESDYSKGQMAKRTKKKNRRYISSKDESPPGTVVRRSPRFKMPTPPEISSHLGNSQFVTDISVVKRNLNLEKEVMTGSVIIPSNLDPSTSKTDSFSQQSSSSIASFIPPSKEYAEVIKLLHIINGRVTQNSELITALLNTQQSDKIPRNEQIGEDIKTPVTSYEELMELDQKLLDPKIRNFLVRKLLHIGGTDVKEVIKRSMAHLVDDSILKEFSWVGGKGKKKFSTLILSSIIKEVCKGNPLTKESTEKAVEERLAIFLTKSTERCNRRMNKENRQ